MSKIVCIYHSIDLDGWMSAAIVKHWFLTNLRPNKSYIINGTRYDRGGNIYSPEILDFIGYNYGQPTTDLSKYDKVIMCDISFPELEMLKLHEEKDLIWIDHHISAIKDIEDYFNQDRDIPNGLRDTKFAACELTWQYFFPNENMPEIVRLLGRYDCFGSKGTDEHQKVLEFQYGARQCITNYEEAYTYLVECLNQHTVNKIENMIHIHGRGIYQYLCTEAKQIYKNGFEIEFEEEEWSYNPNDILSHKRKFICINKERFNPINFGIDYHKEGYDGCACFHYANGIWNFSLYNDNGKVDCSVIAKQYGGGGHMGASGFKCNHETFLKIINV